MQTGIMTLAEFLLARIAEDEEAAAGIDRSRWQTGLGPPLRGDMYRHLSRHHPARVLAECDAKRHIVELRYSWNLQAEKMPEPPFGPILQTQVTTADTILRVLALPYADHPDYREEWRP